MLRIFLFFFPCLLAAQQQVVFDANYQFEDGVYHSHAALLANQPDVRWEGVNGEMVQLAEDNRVQIDGFSYKNRERESPYAIALDGVPYFFVRFDESRAFHEFAGLQIRGPYSTLRYDTTIHTRQLMRAYNPANGLAFREAWVERDRQKSVRRIIDLRTGRRIPFDLPTVMRLVDSESDLIHALRRTDPTETEKLMRALKIYGERHPLRLPLSQLNR